MKNIFKYSGIKKKSFAFLIFPSFVPCLSAQGNRSQIVDVFLIGGQSNATGQGYVRNIPRSFEVDTTVMFYYSRYLNGGKGGDCWRPLCQASESEDKFGVELSLGTCLHKQYPDRHIALIKHALSGSNLYAQWNPGNRVGEAQGEEYAKFIRTVKEGLDKLKKEGYTPILRAMVWQQGEADARDIAGMDKSRMYGKNLNNFICQVRKDLEAEGLLFVYGSVMPMVATRFTGRDIVRNAQKEVAEGSGSSLSLPGTIWVNADDLQMRRSDYMTPMPEDDVHLGTYGVLELGRRFSQVVIHKMDAILNNSKGDLSWEELRERFKCPDWFEKARFGIWLHWGAQSQPAQGGGWYARHMYMPDVKNETWGRNAYPYHCQTYGHPSEKGFKDVIHAWKAEKLNADSLMVYFKKLGAKYFLIMANHHDHFDNFNSTYHPWNSVNVGPKRDIVAEFEKAVKKQGLPFGVTSHDDRFMDWWLPAFGHDENGPYANIPYDGNMTKEDGIGKWWEGLDPADLYGLPPAKRTSEWVEGVKRNWVQRHTELVTKYDVDMLWFDGYGFPYGDYGKDLCTVYYNHLLRKKGRIDGLVAGKFSNESSTIKDIECGGANEILPDVWQGTLTPNSWFYKTERPLRHNARTIIEMLVDMNSKNGNLLLNVELRPDGTLPEDHKAILDEVGAWVNLNSEAIYGSKPWKVYGDNLNSIIRDLKSKKNPSETDLEALRKLEGGKNEQFNERTISSPLYGHDEVRFTTKGDTLYVFVLNPKAGNIKIPVLGQKTKYNICKVKSVSMLGNKQTIKFVQEEDTFTLNVPSLRPNKYATVFKVIFEK